MSTEAHGFEHPDSVSIAPQRDEQNGEFDHDNNDDVWGGSGDEYDHHDRHTISQTTRIQREHHNSGYIEGVTESKEIAIQSGFDDGYPTGASMGLRAGRIIGELQGRPGCEDLERQATEELNVQKVLVPEYWTDEADPIWDPKTTTHPLIVKWESKLKEIEEN